MVDDELSRRLRAAGAVVIEGPKAVGKTETARQLAASEVLLDVDLGAQQAIAVDPSLVLEGDRPRLIDEWQIAPAIWNHVRRQVDDRRTPGQFLLTGSSVPNDEVSRHTGAGRFSFLRMRPMTLYETGHGSGAVSMASLMDGKLDASADPGISIRDIVERITVGGWPGHLGRSPADAAQATRDYIQQIREVDVERVAGGRRDPRKVGRLIQSLARNVATEAALSVLADDAGGADGPLSRNTAAEYLSILDRLMVVEDQPAWAPHLRSRATLRSAAKRHFVDPSLAVAALGSSSDRLLQDMALLGFLFESMVIRDLRVFAQALEGQVYHYRDSYGLEVDAIVQLADGRWAAFEVKLGSARVDEGASTLSRFADAIDTKICGEPEMLAVITGTGFAYVRKDGIGVFPVGALGP